MLNKAQLIIRELWAYQLAISPLPPVAEPVSEDPRKDSPRPAHSEELADDPIDSKDDEKSEEDSTESNPARSDKESESSKEEEPELGVDLEVLAQLSDDSSDSDMLLRDRTLDFSRRSKPRWRRKRRLRISDTVATLVVGLWVMRVPVLNVDIQR